MTFHGLELQLQRATGLYRKIDLRYPSNRLAVIVALTASVLLAVITRDGLISIVSGAATFSAWALGRELDPDRPRTANLSAITVGLALTGFAIAGRLNLQEVLLGALVTGALMVTARVMTRSTGIPTTVLDALTLIAIALGSGLIEPKVGLIVIAVSALSLALDRAFEHHPYLANWCWIGFTFFALTGLVFLWNSGPWLALTGIVFVLGTLNFDLALRSKPSSSTDIGTRLEPARIAVATMLVFVAATSVASQGLPLAIIGLLAVGLWRLWMHP
jgi:hypothetical protein